jgi:hypothetical protein
MGPVFGAHGSWAFLGDKATVVSCSKPATFYSLVLACGNPVRVKCRVLFDRDSLRCVLNPCIDYSAPSSSKAGEMRRSANASRHDIQYWASSSSQLA